MPFYTEGYVCVLINFDGIYAMNLFIFMCKRVTLTLHVIKGDLVGLEGGPL